MATTVKYYITKDGYYLDSQAEPVTTGKKGAAHFPTDTSVSEFIEASGSAGEYTIHIFAEKI